jgi:hypothetical protein
MFHPLLHLIEKVELMIPNLIRCWHDVEIGPVCLPGVSASEAAANHAGSSSPLPFSARIGDALQARAANQSFNLGGAACDINLKSASKLNAAGPQGSPFARTLQVRTRFFFFLSCFFHIVIHDLSRFIRRLFNRNSSITNLLCF